jgi:hypothetical protein
MSAAVKFNSKIRYVHTRETHNLTAAREMVPYFISLLKPQSVADVGCGIGSWLKVFEENGITDILGIDGDYVNKDLLYIRKDQLMTTDLEKPVSITRKFDLVMSLEVAEHLKPEVAETFVETLVGLGDVIVFSAAIPQQGGQNHLNEQWPTYWRDIFRKHGYYFYDVFRQHFWNNKKIDWWYRQNIFLVAKEGVEEKYHFNQGFNEMIHPELFQSKTNMINDFINGDIGVANSFKIFKKAFFKAVSKRILPGDHSNPA